MPQLSAQGPVGLAFPTSEIRTTAHPDWTSGAPPCGQRARDTSGNEYVLVKFAEINYYGGWVVIDDDYNARRIDATTDAGRVGVCMRTVAVSDYGWVMIYGIHPAAQINDSGASSASGMLCVNAVTSQPGVMVVAADAGDSGAITNPIYGAKVMSGVSAATIASGAVVSDAVSSAYTGTWAEVALNYPWASGTLIGNAVTAT